jgi:hypothetical protein
MTKLPANPDRLWQLAQVKEFVKQVQAKVGCGWDYLSEPMREALIAEKALFVVTGLERGDIPCAAIGCLRRDMLIVAGMLEA